MQFLCFDLAAGQILKDPALFQTLFQDPELVVHPLGRRVQLFRDLLVGIIRTPHKQDHAVFLVEIAKEFFQFLPELILVVAVSCRVGDLEVHASRIDIKRVDVITVAAPVLFDIVEQIVLDVYIRVG